MRIVQFIGTGRPRVAGQFAYVVDHVIEQFAQRLVLPALVVLVVRDHGQADAAADRATVTISSAVARTDQA